MTDASPNQVAPGRHTALAIPARAVSIPAWCTGPVAAITDVNSLRTIDANRWSRRGEPTVYLAGDPGVAIAELGRHWDEKEGQIAVWSSHLTLAGAADLRDPTVRATLELPADPTWILETDRCHDVASRIRSTGSHDGLIVPSVAFIDDPSRWNAVVFVEHQSRQLSDVISLGAREIVVGRSPTGLTLD